MKILKDTIYINMKDDYAQYELNNSIYSMVKNIDKTYKRIAILCIGTDRSTGDSFGPLVGYMLSKYTIYDFDVYGTIHEPVHALNLEETIKKIDINNTLVIAIDSSVGYSEYVGYIGVKYGAICPGSGVGKILPAVGDIAISGIVALSGFAPLIMLQSAPLGMVYTMAEKAARSINYVLYKEQLANKKLNTTMTQKPNVINFRNVPIASNQEI